MRVDVKPLLIALGSPDRTDSEIAAGLGVTLQVLSGWRRRGLSLYHADAVAIGAGLHPAQVWPGYSRLPDRTVS